MGTKWDETEEAFLAKLEKQCNYFHRHYNKEYTFYNRLSSKFNIPILVVSAINSLTAVALTTFIPQKYVSIMNAILSAGTGVLGSVQLYMKLNERMANSLRSSISMKRIALKITKELSLSRELRTIDGVAFVQDCFADFNQTLEAGNPIEKKVDNHLELSMSASQPPTPLTRFQELVGRIRGGSTDSNESSETRV